MPALPDHIQACGARLRKKPGKHCRLRAGYKTPHVGQGKCWLHGGLTPIRTGRYSHITHPRLRTIMDELAVQDRNVMDLEPEAQLLRAMVIDYVNRYDQFIDELHRWAQADQRSRGKGAPPPRLELLSLHDARDLVEGTSRVVEKMHKITRESALTLETFRRIMEQMGLVVATHVSDPLTLRAIERDWATMVVEAKSPVVPKRDDADDDAR